MRIDTAATVDKLPTPGTGCKGFPWDKGGSHLAAVRPDGTLWPRITVVTPSYNQGAFLEETIRSVLLQGYPNLEYIVIDGGSTDGSVDTIRRYSPWLTYWTSERDSGQVDAINKGLARATGEIFNWINSDDVLEMGALTRVALAMDGVEAVAGACFSFRDSWSEVKRVAGLDPKGMLTGMRSVTFRQQALWLRPQLVNACGGIDEKFHYVFDWDLTIRYLRLFPHIRYIDNVLARYRLHPSSKTVKEGIRFLEEHVMLAKKYSQGGLGDLSEYLPAYSERARWDLFLATTLWDSTRSRGSRLITVIEEIARAPRQRWRRHTLGVIRRLALG